MPSNINVRQNTDAVAYPTAYRVHEAVIINHAGREYDIYPIVSDFTITESLYNPSLILSLNVKDPINLFEELQLSGQEKIRIKIWKERMLEDGGTEQHHIDHEFIVTEYPAYGKFNNYLQAYTIKGVSPHAFYTKFKKISRAFSGTIQDFIYDVLTRDLKYDANSIVKSNKSTANISFIVPNLNPIDAISWALRRAYDETGAPWYCYETLKEGADSPGGMIYILPQSDLVLLYETAGQYEEGISYHYNPYTAADFAERTRRILSISSQINLSKYISGGNGAYGSTTEYVDIATKKRTRKTFNYNNEYSQMIWANARNGKNLSSNFKLDNRPISDYSDAKINYVPINSKAFTNKANYHSSTVNGMINRANSYIENLDSITHDITLAGDFYLNAGNRVELSILKAIDPSVKVRGAQHTDENQELDLMLSGEYIVTSVVHSFKDKHTCDVRMKRDSMMTPFTGTTT